MHLGRCQDLEKGAQHAARKVAVSYTCWTHVVLLMAKGDKACPDSSSEQVRLPGGTPCHDLHPHRASHCQEDHGLLADMGQSPGWKGSELVKTSVVGRTPVSVCQRLCLQCKEAFVPGDLGSVREFTTSCRTTLGTATVTKVPNLGRISVNNEPHGLRVETVDESALHSAMVVHADSSATCVAHPCSRGFH